LLPRKTRQVARLLCPWGFQPKANIVRSASADRLKGTNYGNFWGKRLLLPHIRGGEVGEDRFSVCFRNCHEGTKTQKYLYGELISAGHLAAPP